MATKEKYFIHYCYNGDKYECESRYQVGKRAYMRWADDYGFDCFDEVNENGENHLFIDFGDCDYPVDVTYLYNCTFM